MKARRALFSALRALSTVPYLPVEELERFSQNVDEESPAANASFGASPVWRIPRGTKPPVSFRRLLAKLDEGFGFAVHNDFFALRFDETALALPLSTLHAIVGEAAHERLTAAEMRVAIQLLQGQNLKDAAKADNVAYETKRSHFKVLAAKLEIRGQSEVVRVLTNKLFRKLAHLAEPRMRGDLDEYASSYLPAAVRRLRITTKTGLDLSVLDYGPATGTPLIVLHPMILPPIGWNEIAHAERQGLRLLWPLRCGLLDRSAPIQSGKKHLDESVEGLLAVLDQLIGQPVPVLALVSSGAVATRAALRRPERISSICFAATCYSAGRTGPSYRYFGADLIELALRSEAMMSRTVTAMRNYADTDKRFRSMLETVFQGSHRDLAHIAAEFSSVDAGKRLRSAILNSAESIKQDFFNQTHFRWSELLELETPIRFLQGAEDAIHPPSDFAPIVNKLSGTSLSILEGMGHLPHRGDLRRVIDIAGSAE